MPHIHHPSYAGIDGCRYGWVVVAYMNGVYNIELFANFDSLMKQYNSLDRILIDMPIGLSTKHHPRTIDATLRKQLPGRGSTVFNVPCKSAVYTQGFETAKKVNLEEEGKSISIQTYNIQSKIREVDQYLTQVDKTTEVIESHPEFCFAQLKDDVLLSRKNKPDGQEERLKLLEMYDPSIIDIFNKGMQQFKRKDVKADDIIDAMCLCLANRLAGKNNLQFITDENKYSKDGFPYKVAYWKP